MRGRIGALVDAGQAFAARHARAIGWLSTAWLMLVAFSHAGFVPLPDLAILDGRAALIASTAWNAGWWGFLRPALERRWAAAPPIQDAAETS